MVFYKEPNFSFTSKHAHKKVAVAAIVVPAACKSLSTLSQKSETVAVVSPFSATVSLFCDSVDRA